MEIERETVIEAAVSLAGVGSFIILLIVIGLLFNNGGLSGQGGFAVLGAIVFFVIVMSVIGYWLAGRES
ncbi:MAG: hypothetical protein SVG88_13285 [Halobacteriales archaeon]|nr:hypothetical protein [Halobacteriales archaeon]